MRQCAVVASVLAFLLMPTLAGAAEPAPLRVSGPVLHDNLAVYLIHGPSQAGPVPLTLQEALEQGVVRVRETSNVNSLDIENIAAKPVFVHAGDIVKGGKQDRTLTVSLLLPPKSGRIPIASFCVEHGRWSPRAREDAHNFSSAAAMVPSREMKLAMQAPLTAPSPSRYGETGLRQVKVWDSVRRAQERLSSGAGADVRSLQSASSLQLALENEKLSAARDAYVTALKAAGEKDDDIIGFVFAVNGRLNSGDAYMSNALFRKMWPKLLAASATEAIGRRNDTAVEPPPAQAAGDFLKQVDAGKASERQLNFGMRRVLHEGDRGYLIEAASSTGWVHRSYLAK